jgi:hypothetical protein
VHGQNVLRVSHSVEEIKAAIVKQILYGSYPKEILYGDGMAGIHIANALAHVKLSIDKKISY